MGFCIICFRNFTNKAFKKHKLSHYNEKNRAFVLRRMRDEEEKLFKKDKKTN